MSTNSRVGKSETREMLEKDVIRVGSANRMHEPTEWGSGSNRGNVVFLIAVAVILGAIVLALVVLR